MQHVFQRAREFVAKAEDRLHRLRMIEAAFHDGAEQAPVLAEIVGGRGHECAQELFGRCAVRMSSSAPDARARILGERFGDGGEQRALVLEAEIDRAHGTARFLGDVGHPRAVIALFGKHGLGRFQQALARGAAARLRGGKRPAFGGCFSVAACLRHAGGA